jgi:hypothetical protein
MSQAASYALSEAARHTMAGWHRFVATRDAAVLSPLLAQDIVFRSPVVHAPIPGHRAAMLVLTTVVTIFEEFQYHREFVAGPLDAGLEFTAKVGDRQLKGIDLIAFNAAGEMREFEVLIRPMSALQALSDTMTARIGPQLATLKAAAKG